MLNKKFSGVDIIFNFSDGSAAQHKNQKMFKWYFYATSHCKGPCDVVGGTVKWPATKASLQRVYSFQIMTPGQVLSGQLRTFQECILNTVQLMTTKKKPSSS